MFDHLKAHITNYAWGFALLLPAVLMYLLQFSNLNWACTNFIVVFSAALVMWIFRLVPEYAPAVFVILAIMLLGLLHNRFCFQALLQIVFFYFLAFLAWAL